MRALSGYRKRARQKWSVVFTRCSRGVSRQSYTADTALRIGKALGTTPEFWLHLQRMYDLDTARATTNLDDIVPLIEATS